MIDFSRVEGFEWDAGNAMKSTKKHGVSQLEAEQVFFCRSLLVVQDHAHSRYEPRYHALGVTLQDRKLHVTFTLRRMGTRIRVISARDMHRKERAIYEQKIKSEET